MTRLTRLLRERHAQVPDLWIKRDDCTGLATGGNKTRKLEFLVGDALAQGADTLITQGATQSNHARQTAAAAAVTGLDCKILLEQRQVRDEEYEQSGNVLLDELLGAEIVQRLAGRQRHAGGDGSARRGVAGERQGARTSSPAAARTRSERSGTSTAPFQLDAAPVAVDWVVHGTGSTGTQAGLVAGFAAINSAARVLGVSVRQPEQRQVDAVFGLAERTAELIGTTVDREDVLVDDRWVGGGYGVPTDEMVAATGLLASTEGILLDPVYSGKGFAGLLGGIAEGRFDANDTVVFLHTGGSVGLFGYRSTFQ